MKQAIRASMIVMSVAWASLVPVHVLADSASVDARPDFATLDYIGSIELRPERGELSAGWTILIPDTSRNDIRFALSSSFGTAHVTGPDVVDMTSRLTDDRARRLYQITLAPAKTEKPRQVRFSYGGPLQTPPVNRLDERTVELTVESGWYPYDPDLAQRLTAQVGVQIGEDWTPVVIEDVEPAGPGYRIRQTYPAFDIAMSWLLEAQITETLHYRIFDIRTEPGSQIDRLKQSLSACRAVFEGILGPLPDASVLVTDRAYAAYSRGTFISLMDIENETEESLFKIVCHELSHDWSQASPGGPDDWINEGFAEFLALMAVRARFGEAAYQSYLKEFEESLTGEVLPPIWTAEATDRTPYLNSYRAAPLALAELEQRMGQAAFLTFLQSIMEDGIRDTPRLLAHLEAMAGTDIRNEFERRLSE